MDIVKKGTRGVLAALIALACGLVVGFGLVGCQSEESQVKDALTQELDTIKNHNEDAQQVFKEAGGDYLLTLGLDSTTFLDAWLEGFSYEIGDVTLGSDGKTADVAVTITAKRLDTAFDVVINELPTWIADNPSVTEEEALNHAGTMIIEQLKATSPSTSNVIINLTKSDQGWAVSEQGSNGLYEAMLGSMVSTGGDTGAVANEATN